MRKAEGETWERRVHAAYSDSRDYGAALDPEGRYLAILIPKPRPSADFLEVRTELHLRVLDWKTGSTVLDSILPEEIRPSYVREVGRDFEYILLATGGPSPYCLFWRKTETYRTWDGLASWSKDGSISAFRQGLQGELVRDEGGRASSTPAAPGQLGSIVKYAVDPSGRYLAAIDEAGTFFLRELALGRTLLSCPMKTLPAYAVRPSVPLPLSLSGPKHRGAFLPARGEFQSRPSSHPENPQSKGLP